MLGTVVTGTGGKRYKLTKRIGGGGEGEVFLTQGRNAVKIYKPGKATPERRLKLSAMIANPPDDPAAAQNHCSIAWPKEIVFNDSRDFVGYLMPQIVALDEISAVYHAPTRISNFPAFTWEYLLYTVRNMASALAAIHHKGYVVGDLNERNVLVAPTAMVSFIDTDSMQVKGSSTSKVYRCTVGKTEYTAPELQGTRLADVDRTPDQDCFALAVLAFMLLMEGRHPYDGIDPSSDEQPSYAEMIQRNWFGSAYGGTGGRIRPPATSLPFKILPAELRALFLRTFVDGHASRAARPTADEWVTAIDRVRASLTHCHSNPQHVFGSHLSSCPWCERVSKLNLKDPFPAIRKAGKQVPLPPITPTIVPPNPVASPGAKSQTSQTPRSNLSQSIPGTISNAISRLPGSLFRHRTFAWMTALLALAVIATGLARFRTHSDLALTMTPTNFSGSGGTGRVYVPQVPVGESSSTRMELRDVTGVVLGTTKMSAQNGRTTGEVHIPANDKQSPRKLELLITTSSGRQGHFTISQAGNPGVEEARALAQEAKSVLDRVEERIIFYSKNPPPPQDIRRIREVLKQQCDQACEMGNRALVLAPSSREAYLCVVQARRFSGDESGALQIARKAIQQFPGDPELQSEIDILTRSRQ